MRDVGRFEANKEGEEKGERIVRFAAGMRDVGFKPSGVHASARSSSPSGSCSSWAGW